MIVVERQSQLLHVVFALSPAGGFPGLLDGGEKQCDQDGDDRDDHQQLNQGEAGAAAMGGGDFFIDRPLKNRKRKGPEMTGTSKTPQLKMMPNGVRPNEPD